MRSFGEEFGWSGEEFDLIAGEWTGELCGERKWEWREEWLELEEPGLGRRASGNTFRTQLDKVVV